MSEAMTVFVFSFLLAWSLFITFDALRYASGNGILIGPLAVLVLLMAWSFTDPAMLDRHARLIIAIGGALAAAIHCHTVTEVGK